MLTATPKVYSVNELNNYVKQSLDNDENLKYIYVTGEISNFKDHYSGHLYMTIKDDNASIKAVMFKGNAMKLRFKPDNGMKVIIMGTVSLFPRDGSYQLYITAMQPDGFGELSVAYEQLKKKLATEGLFDASHKKPIPKFPEKIGVITSATGAAIQDIFNVLKRRYPIAKVVVRPAQVQGDSAAPDIASAIKEFNDLKGADVLIVGRGGGSIEDLWAFNEEIVARAIYASNIPVISAVGHETDYTICDFVSDLRAPTPSAAAELAVPDISELKNQILNYKQELVTNFKSYITEQKVFLENIKNSSAMRDPVVKISDSRRELAYYNERLCNLVRVSVDSKKQKFTSLVASINALNPLGVISRGYAIASKDNKIITSVDELKIGDILNVKLSNGQLKANITEINKD